VSSLASLAIQKSATYCENLTQISAKIYVKFKFITELKHRNCSNENVNKTSSNEILQFSLTVNTPVAEMKTLLKTVMKQQWRSCAVDSVVLFGSKNVMCTTVTTGSDAGILQSPQNVLFRHWSLWLQCFCYAWRVALSLSYMLSVFMPLLPAVLVAQSNAVICPSVRPSARRSKMGMR